MPEKCFSFISWNFHLFFHWFKIISSLHNVLLHGLDELQYAFGWDVSQWHRLLLSHFWKTIFRSTSRTSMKFIDSLTKASPQSWLNSAALSDHDRELRVLALESHIVLLDEFSKKRKQTQRLLHNSREMTAYLAPCDSAPVWQRWTLNSLTWGPNLIFLMSERRILRGNKIFLRRTKMC
jgi:hypothetical protein